MTILISLKAMNGRPPSTLAMVFLNIWSCLSVSMTCQQSFKIFFDMTNMFIIIYLNNILIYSDHLEDNCEHVHKVLAHLQEHNLHVKLEKCTFHTNPINYLSFVVSPLGISMDSIKTKIIQE